MPKAKKPKKANMETTVAAASGVRAARSAKATRAATAAELNPAVAGRTRGLRSQVSLSPSVIKNSDKILSELRTKKTKKVLTPIAVQATDTLKEHQSQEEVPSSATASESGVEVNTNYSSKGASTADITAQADTKSSDKEADAAHSCEEASTTSGDVQPDTKPGSTETDIAYSGLEAGATDSDVQADNWTDYMETDTDAQTDTVDRKADSANSVRDVIANIESYISGIGKGAHTSNSSGAARSIGEGNSNRAGLNVTGRVPSVRALPGTDYSDGEDDIYYQPLYSPYRHLAKLVSKRSYVDHAVQTEQPLTVGTRGKGNLTKVDCYVADCPTNVALEGLTLSREELEMIFAHRGHKQVSLNHPFTPVEMHTPMEADESSTTTKAHTPTVVNISSTVTEAHTPTVVYSPDQIYNWTDKRNFTNFASVDPTILGVGELSNDAVAIMPNPSQGFFTNADDPRWIEGNADLFRQTSKPPTPTAAGPSEDTKSPATQTPPAEYRLPFELDEMLFQQGVEPNTNDVDMLADELSEAASRPPTGPCEVTRVGVDANEDIGSSSITPMEFAYPSPPAADVGHYVYGTWPPASSESEPVGPPTTPTRKGWNFLSLPNSIARGFSSTVSSLLSRRQAVDSVVDSVTGSGMPQNPIDPQLGNATEPARRETRKPKRVTFNARRQSKTLSEIDEEQRNSVARLQLWKLKKQVTKQKTGPLLKSAMRKRNRSPMRTTSSNIVTANSATTGGASLTRKRKYANPPGSYGLPDSIFSSDSDEPVTPTPSPRETHTTERANKKARVEVNSSMEEELPTPLNTTNKKSFPPPPGTSFGLSDAFYAYSSSDESDEEKEAAYQPQVTTPAGPEPPSYMVPTQTQVTWTKPPPPAPTPAHAKLPGDRTENTESLALARARSLTELYKPARPSGLRRVSVLSTSTISPTPSPLGARLDDAAKEPAEAVQEAVLPEAHQAEQVETHQAEQIGTHQPDQIGTHQAEQIETHQAEQIETHQTEQIEAHQAEQIETHQAEQIETHQAQQADTQPADHVGVHVPEPEIQSPFQENAHRTGIQPARQVDAQHDEGEDGCPQTPLAVDLPNNYPDVEFSPSDPSGLGSDPLVMSRLDENWTSLDDKRAVSEWAPIFDYVKRYHQAEREGRVFVP